MLYYVLVVKDRHTTLVEDAIQSSNFLWAWKEANRRYQYGIQGIFQAEDEKNIVLKRLRDIFNVINKYIVTSEDEALKLVEKKVWTIEDYVDYRLKNIVCL